MPELPEVETVRSVLAPLLVGQKITGVTVLKAKAVATGDPENFAKNLAGQKLTALTRRGKYLTFHLANGAQMVLHFRMTGVLTLENPDAPRVPHTHLVWQLGNGQELRFSDARGFGRCWYYAPGAVDRSGQQLLGPEPAAVTATYLQQHLARHRPLKTLLLDQHLVAGLGNIYSDEVCYRCHLNPAQLGDSLTKRDWQQLALQIPAVINEFIAVHQVDFATYAQSGGTSYQTATNLRVYGRAGQPCLTCGTTLVGARLGGRSTVYCPICQKMPSRHNPDHRACQLSAQFRASRRN